MSTASPAIQETVRPVINDLMGKVIEQASLEYPSTREKLSANVPLYAALISDEISKDAIFERNFVAYLSNAWEELAVSIARRGLGHSIKRHTITGTIKLGRLIRIKRVLYCLEHLEKGIIEPDWDNQLAYVLAGRGQNIPVQVVCDVYTEDAKNNRKYAFELGAPFPNSNQAKNIKEKLLKLYCMEPPRVSGAYFALPYNPFGKREDYDWGFPSRWFDMKQDPVVLIGDEFWQKIGGMGTYQAFIQAVNEIGAEYKDRIYREFLGIEPPQITLP